MSKLGCELCAYRADVDWVTGESADGTKVFDFIVINGTEMCVCADTKACQTRQNKDFNWEEQCQS